MHVADGQSLWSQVWLLCPELRDDSGSWMQIPGAPHPPSFMPTGESGAPASLGDVFPASKGGPHGVFLAAVPITETSRGDAIPVLTWEPRNS